MVAGENAETAGIIRDRFVKAKLGREIGDRSLDRRAGAAFPVGILPRKIISERVVNLFQFAEESFVLSELFESGLPRELEHANRIVVRAIPQIGIEMAEEAAGRRL